MSDEDSSNEYFDFFESSSSGRTRREVDDEEESDELGGDWAQNRDNEISRDYEDSMDSIWSIHTTSDTTFDSEPQVQNVLVEAIQGAEGMSTSSPVKSSDESGDETVPLVLLIDKPRTRWSAVKDWNKRSMGLSCHKSIENVFNSRCYGSLRFVQRMELDYKMDCHNGCVNALHFNTKGSRLASGSDDLSVILWDWAKAKPLLNYDSGHRGNIFQVKFLPLSGDMHIVSCARDGHIRLAELSTGGSFHSTRRLGLHRGPAHKLAILPDTPHVFLSCGEDALVLEVDVRQSKPNRLLTVKQGERKVALYSIYCHPVDTNEFCVGGRDQFVRIYDRRRVAPEGEVPLKKYCPSHLLDSSVRAHVTCAVYNYNGSELCASYNDEDIYLFSTQPSNAPRDVLHHYQGHRNNATVKGVNFYGPESQFVISGSDCGNIFFWDKNTEAIVQCVPGDENGVVNCLEPHPSMPVLATSGLDDDVKIWTPKNFEEPSLSDLKSTIKTNKREREEERRREPETVDGEMLWILWRHIRRTERRRRQQNQQRGDGGVAERSNSSSSSEDSDGSDSEESPRGLQCAPS